MIARKKLVISNLIPAIIFTGLDQVIFRGKLPFTLKHPHADHETLIPANKAKKIQYPKYDNILRWFFDITSFAMNTILSINYKLWI